MLEYLVRFYEGTARDSQVFLEVSFRARNDLAADKYRKFIERGIENEGGYNICTRKGYEVDD